MYSRSNIVLLAVAIVLAGYWILRLVNDGYTLAENSQDVPVETVFVNNSEDTDPLPSFTGNKAPDTTQITNTSVDAKKSATKNLIAETVEASKAAKVSLIEPPVIAAAEALPVVTASRTVVITLSAAPATANPEDIESEADKNPVVKSNFSEPTSDQVAVEAGIEQVEDSQLPETDENSSIIASSEQSTTGTNTDELNDSDASGSDATNDEATLPATQDSNNIQQPANVLRTLTIATQAIDQTETVVQSEQEPLIITTEAFKKKPEHATHKITKGDTLYSLARRFNTTIDKLMTINNISSDQLYVGETLLYPAQR